MRSVFLSHRGHSVILMLVFGAVLAGCSVNPLSSLHKDGADKDATVLVADGKAAMSRGDYTKAVEYFNSAVQIDPRNSEARLGYAESELKRRHFNLYTIIDTIIKSDSNSTSASATPVLLKPEDWGCAQFSELTTLFTTMINMLDPIAQGLTQGSTQSNDVTLNLNTGLFYALRTASQAQQLSNTFQVEQLSKSTTTLANLNTQLSQLGLQPLNQSQYDQLPDSFWWLTSSTAGSLTAVISQIQSDINTGIARLQVAAANSSANARKAIEDAIDAFASLQTQFNQ